VLQVNILITGDLYINQIYEASQIGKSVTALFKKSDLNMVNLEAPVTVGDSKILKTGPNMKADKDSTAQVIKALAINVVTLANNHILDYDEQGLEDTLTFCKEQGIQTVGAGRNLEEASKTLFIDDKEGKIALVNFAENEWASATFNTAGAHPMDLIDNVKKIKEAKEVADFVFVIVHGGHEYYKLPSPRMQKQYRFYAEQGADLVVGHHTHCINGHETHQGVPIFYSLGNFLFTEHCNDEDWYTGLILEVEISKGKISSFLHPVRQQKGDFRLSLLEGKEKEEILHRIMALNAIIGDKTKLEVEWNGYVTSKSASYLHAWSPASFIGNYYINRALYKLGLRLINRGGMALYLNLMRCEAHCDLSKAVLKRYIQR